MKWDLASKVLTIAFEEVGLPSKFNRNIVTAVSSASAPTDGARIPRVSILETFSKSLERDFTKAKGSVILFQSHLQYRR